MKHLTQQPNTNKSHKLHQTFIVEKYVLNSVSFRIHQTQLFKLLASYHQYMFIWLYCRSIFLKSEWNTTHASCSRWRSDVSVFNRDQVKSSEISSRSPSIFLIFTAVYILTENSWIQSWFDMNWVPVLLDINNKRSLLKRLDDIETCIQVYCCISELDPERSAYSSSLSSSSRQTEQVRWRN